MVGPAWLFDAVQWFSLLVAVVPAALLGLFGILTATWLNGKSERFKSRQAWLLDQARRRFDLGIEVVAILNKMEGVRTTAAGLRGAGVPLDEVAGMVQRVLPDGTKPLLEAKAKGTVLFSKEVWDAVSRFSNAWGVWFVMLGKGDAGRANMEMAEEQIAAGINAFTIAIGREISEPNW